MENKEYFHGRRILTSSYSEVTEANVIAVIGEVIGKHNLNASEIRYLRKYVRGEQPILSRVKQIRPEINNKVLVNRANEIVSFETGYIFSEPIQYVSREEGENVTRLIKQLNDMMYSESKQTCDLDIGECNRTCGTAYRFVAPDTKPGEDAAPFEISTLDPERTFVVYSDTSAIHPILGVNYTDSRTLGRTYTAYTENRCYKIRAGKVIKAVGHALGAVPIIEYPANNMRMGSFEKVLSLLDAINVIESNRVDGVEQFVQSFMKFVNCDIDEVQFERMKQLGAIKVVSREGLNADVEMISNELSQDQTQVLLDDLYKRVLTVVGMPDMTGDSSSSDSGRAVILDKGWSLAEARAKISEVMFKRSEQRFLKIVLTICNLNGELMNLSPYQIDMKFTRRNYEDIQSKSQVLTTLLANNHVDPRLAFQVSGLFSDPEGAYLQSCKWVEDGGWSSISPIQNPLIQAATPSGSSEESSQDDGNIEVTDDSAQEES